MSYTKQVSQQTKKIKKKKLLWRSRKTRISINDIYIENYKNLAPVKVVLGITLHKAFHKRLCSHY